MASYKDIKRRNRFKLLCALIGALIVAFAFWLAGPVPSGF
jgi:predicted nucleic acid-binding Zn ribbon protein